MALKGVTGATHLRTDGIAEQIARIRSHTDLPIMIGFGIKDGTTARMVAPLADGVVVGSSLVTTMERLEREPERIAPALLEQVREIRTAIDNRMTVRTLDDWLAHAERVHPVGIDMGLARVRRVVASVSACCRPRRRTSSWPAPTAKVRRRSISRRCCSLTAAASARRCRRI